METLSSKISEHIQMEVSLMKPIIIDDIDKIKMVHGEMNKDSFLRDITKYIDDDGSISIRDRYNDGCESRTNIYKLNSPFIFGFSYKNGRFIDGNIFQPSVCLVSDTNGLGSDVDNLKNVFIRASIRSKVIEQPQITLPEPYERINLSDLSPEMNDIICYKSEAKQIGFR